jgi:hypothetical protein
MRKGILLACAGAILALLVPSGAMAQRGEAWWRDIEPWLDSRARGDSREARLWADFARLRSEVRRAERRRDLSPREADRLLGRLDRVGRFLRDDRNLSDKEYKRRRKDLDGVARDLERATGRRVAPGFTSRR